MARVMLQELCEHYLDADSLRSCYLGTDASEAARVVDVTLGWLDATCSPADPPLTPADVVMLDDTLADSEISMELRQRGFQGMLCVFTSFIEVCV